MLAALVDPDYNDRFWSMTESVAATMEVKRKLEWKTQTQTEDIYGAEQFKTMERDGSFRKRRDPSNLKFFEYLKRTDSATGTTRKTQEFATEGSKRLKKDGHDELVEKVRHFGIDDQMMDDFMQHGGLHSMAY